MKASSALTCGFDSPLSSATEIAQGNPPISVFSYSIHNLCAGMNSGTAIRQGFADETDS